jgi:hypothetical protein
MPTFDFTAPDGKTHSIEGPEGATREQAFQMLQLKLGGQSAPAAPKESFGSDLAKSVGSGLEQGTATALGLPGDVASLAHSVAPQRVIDAVKAVPGAKALYDHLPGRQAILDSASDPLVDPNYQPQSAAGRYSQAIAKNAGPGLVTGMGPLATTAGAVAGQAAYDATGSHLAEAGGNLAASIAAPLALARYGARLGLSGRQAMMPLQDAAQVRDIANAHYADPLLRDTRVAPQAVNGLAGDMQQALNDGRSAFLPAQAPEVTRGIEALANRGPAVGPPAPMSIEELHSFRKTLGEMGQEMGPTFRPTEQAAAAGRARRVLDQYLDNIPSRDVVSGNPIDAVQSLRDANRNWMAQSGATRVGNMIGNAEVQNASTHSAMNLGNTTRQKLRPLLMNDAAELRRTGNADVIPEVERAVYGGPQTNIARTVSNMLGGGGGIGSTIIGHGINAAVGGAGGYEGYQHGGIGGMIAGTAAGMLPGRALRMLANHGTARDARAVQEAMLAKAPVNANIVARNNAARLANAHMYSNAIGQNGIPSILLNALMLKKYGSN